MKIALFGGSFNPPHVAHVLAGTWVLSTQEVDAIWYVPTYKHAFGKQLEDFDLRCEMLELATEPLGSAAHVSRVERDIGKTSRTIDTLEYLMARRPEEVFSLVIGADILLESDKWKAFDRLEQLAPFHVLGRAGFSVPSRPFDLELPEVSSTEIRRLLASNQIDPCRTRVPAKVLELIQRERLYGFGDA